MRAERSKARKHARPLRWLALAAIGLLVIGIAGLMLAHSASVGRFFEFAAIYAGMWLRPPYAGAFTPWSVIAVCAAMLIAPHRSERASSAGLFIIAAVAATTFPPAYFGIRVAPWAAFAAWPLVTGCIFCAWGAWRIRSVSAGVLMFAAVLIEAAHHLGQAVGRTPPGAIDAVAQVLRHVPAHVPQYIAGASALVFAVAAAARAGRAADAGDDAPLPAGDG